MKKLIAVIAVFMGMMLPKAYTMEVLGTNNTLKYEYKLETRNNLHLYNFRVDDNTKIKDLQYVKNLAYLGNSTNDMLTNATIEKMILENANDCEVNIYNENGDKINTDSIEKSLLTKLEEFKIAVDINNKTYEVGLNDKIILTSSNSTIEAYAPEIGVYTINNGTYTLYCFLKTGVYTYPFVPRVQAYNNKIYSAEAVHNNFSINLEVNVSKVEFISTSENYSFDFEIYDLNGNYLNDVTITKENSILYYEKGLSIVIKDVTLDSGYNPIADIYIDGSTNNTQIELDKLLTPKSYNLSITTNITDLKTKTINNTSTNAEVYDIDNNLISTCISENSCIYNLTGGTYRILDKLTGKMETITLDSNREYVINYNYINGLISDNNLTTIANQNIEGETTYALKNSLVPDIYQIIIDGNTYKIDLTKEDNYVDLGEQGLYYQVDISALELISEKDETENITPEISTDISENINKDINVPNTNINYNGGNYEKVYDRRRNYSKYLWV